MTDRTEMAEAPADGAGRAVAGGVRLAVNGEAREVPAGWTLADLLRSLELDARLVVIEHNRVILRDRARYGELALREGDALEIVHFVGGG